MEYLCDYSNSSDDDDDDNKEVNGGTLQRIISSQQGAVTILSSEFAAKDEFERTIPHIRGYWAGHVFFRLIKPSSNTNEDDTDDDDTDNDSDKQDHHSKRRKLSTTTTRMTTNIRTEAPTVDSITMQQVRLALEHSGWSGTLLEHADWHVSLTRPFMLPLAFVESYLQDIQTIVSHERMFVLRLHTRDIRILTNDEGTRTFLVWNCSNTATLTRLVRQIDSVMQKKYNLQPYYQSPIFHVSFASFRGLAPASLATNLLINHVQELGDIPNDMLFPCRNISCTFGTTKKVDFTLLE
jgi:Uncharacterised conserved protein